MRKFLKEFKAFVSRGNVMDLAVGVIIGGAFSAIVTALTSHILMPLINWVIYAITGGKGIEGVYTFLTKATTADGLIDLDNSLYIDWGAFIAAIINFLLIALVLFLIIKAFNGARELAENARCGYSVEEYNKLVASGKSQKEIRILAAKRDEAAAQKAAEEAEAAKKAASEPSSTDKLLMEIRDELKKR